MAFGGAAFVRQLGDRAAPALRLRARAGLKFTTR